MISEKLVQAINKQIVAEMWSANLYLSMSYFVKQQGFDGFAHWLKKQSVEEMEHSYGLADYVIKRGGNVVIGKVDEVPVAWDSIECLRTRVQSIGYDRRTCKFGFRFARQGVGGLPAHIRKGTGRRGRYRPGNNGACNQG